MESRVENRLFRHWNTWEWAGLNSTPQATSRGARPVVPSLCRDEWMWSVTQKDVCIDYVEEVGGKTLWSRKVWIVCLVSDWRYELSGCFQNPKPVIVMWLWKSHTVYLFTPAYYEHLDFLLLPVNITNGKSEQFKIFCCRCAATVVTILKISRLKFLDFCFQA